MSRSAIGISIGFVCYLALWWAMFAAAPRAAEGIPMWYGPFMTIVSAISSVAPGFIAGWYSGRRGFLLGALSGVLASLASLVATLIFVQGLTVGTLIVTFIFGTAACVVTQSIGGAAGQCLRLQRAAP